MSEHGPYGNEGYCTCGYYMRQSMDVCVPHLIERESAAQERIARTLVTLREARYWMAPVEGVPDGDAFVRAVASVDSLIRELETQEVVK